MKSIRNFSLRLIRPLALFLMAIFLFPTLQAQQDSPFAGIWQGAIEIQNSQLGLIFEITQQGEKLICSMDVPLQKAKGIPADRISTDDREITISYLILNGEYQGKLAPDQQSIDGTWTQNGQTFDMPLTRKADKSELTLRRPQEPVPPFPYEQEDHFFENRAAKINLSGTLTLPKGSGPYPAAILISGSGPQDRNEEIFGHKPFLVIADYLTRRGVAVFRYDDRGVGQSSGDFASATSVHFANDAEAAFDFLREHPKIASDKIGFIGHSEGGLLAPMVAAKRSEVAFNILLAAPGIPMSEIIVWQSAQLSRAEGTPEAQVLADSLLTRQIIDLFTNEKNLALRNEQLSTILRKEYEQMSEEEQEQAGDFELVFMENTRGLDTPWMHFLLTYNPADALEKTACPVLAINGTLDLQVAANENLQAIEQALEKGKCTDYKIVKVPNHNHLMQKTETGALSEYAKNEETFAPEVLEIMGDWLLERF